MDIKVGMADLNVCSGTDTITTLGLGSCVGVVLWDAQAKVCGMLHAMLPDSTSIRNNSNVAKFVDSGIDELLKRVLAKGARRQNLVAKIAGGAQMFSVSNKSDLIAVGKRNAEASVKKLNALRIPIRAQDTGGSCGRTVTFYPENGQYHIKCVGKETKII
ncbi:MAG: chemotaxis protein CheD [Lachnospiraceae bacterium]|nr:chemotaxis protein CheD [Lachnospiraceae bacterium]MCI7594927.1 chemotaxis protein CheD [Lachnospiraceae bacterium]MDY3224171.1 chemotaxis protein CheD [Lachnospiraceae bacterium]